MPEADLLLYLDHGLPPADWRQLARRLAAVEGIAQAAPVAGEGGRLVHVRYDPDGHTPAGVRRAASALGHPGRVVGL